MAKGHPGAFVKAIGWWWLAALLNISAFAQEVGMRAKPTWDGVMPSEWLWLLGTALLFVGMYRAYAKVADDRDALNEEAQSPPPEPLDLLIASDTAFVFYGIPYAYFPDDKDYTMAVLDLELTVTNRGRANVNLQFALRAPHPLPKLRPDGIDIPHDVAPIPERYREANTVGPTPLHIEAQGPAVAGRILFALDHPIHQFAIEAAAEADDGALLIATDLLTDQTVEVPLRLHVTPEEES